MKEINKKKLLIELWGTYPPPYGGVTVHLKRLFHRLKEEPSFELIFLNFNGTVHAPEENILKVKFLPWAFVALIFKKKRILHIHTRQVLAWVLIRIFGFRHRKLITLHNQILRFENGWLKKKLIRFGLNGFDKIILNDNEYGHYIIKNFNVDSQKLKYIGAFLPPLESEFTGLPEEIIRFRKRKKYLLSANAWQLVLINGNDLYGFDTLINLVFELKKTGLDIGLIFLLPQKGDAEYYRKMITKIDELDLNDDILIYEKGLANAFEVWAISDLFLRPTYSDIEGLSVKEALFVGTPVIASDVCQRPKNCYVYHYGDFNDILDKAKDVLKGTLKFHKIEDMVENFDLITDTYKELMKK